MSMAAKEAILRKLDAGQESVDYMSGNAIDHMGYVSGGANYRFVKGKYLQ